MSGLSQRLKAAGLVLEGEPTFPDLSALIHPDMLQGVTLRDYQVAALHLFGNISRGVVAHATGAGKSEFLAAVMQMIGPPSLCIVDTTASAGQLATRLRDRGLRSVGRRDIPGTARRAGEPGQRFRPGLPGSGQRRSRRH